MLLAPTKPAALATSNKLPFGNWLFLMSSMVSGEQNKMPVAVAVRKVICLCVISLMFECLKVYLPERLEDGKFRFSFCLLFCREGAKTISLFLFDPLVTEDGKFLNKSFFCL